MDQEQIDEKLLEGELAGEPMGEQQETEDDPMKNELNQEAIDATGQVPVEEPEGKPEETPAIEEQKPAQGQQDTKVDGAFANMRRENAMLRAQIDSQKVAPQQEAAPSAPTEKSPRQLYLDENPDAEFFPPSVEVAQDQWKADQSTRAVETTRQQTELEVVTKSLEESYVAITNETHGVGLQTLHSLGAHLLTPNDNARIYIAGPEAGEQMHSILTKRVRDAGLYPQASSAVNQTPNVGGQKPPAPKPQEPTQSEEPELDEHNARICEDLHLRR